MCDAYEMLLCLFGKCAATADNSYSKCHHIETSARMCCAALCAVFTFAADKRDGTFSPFEHAFYGRKRLRADKLWSCEALDQRSLKRQIKRNKEKKKEKKVARSELNDARVELMNNFALSPALCALCVHICLFNSFARSLEFYSIKKVALLFSIFRLTVQWFTSTITCCVTLTRSTLFLLDHKFAGEHIRRRTSSSSSLSSFLSFLFFYFFSFTGILSGFRWISFRVWFALCWALT